MKQIVFGVAIGSIIIIIWLFVLPRGCERAVNVVLPARPRILEESSRPSAVNEKGELDMTVVLLATVINEGGNGSVTVVGEIYFKSRLLERKKRTAYMHAGNTMEFEIWISKSLNLLQPMDDYKIYLE